MKYALVYLLYQLLLRICADFEDERQVFLYSVTTLIFLKNIWAKTLKSQSPVYFLFNKTINTTTSV